MSSPSKRFECRWQPSRRLLEIYLCTQALACLAVLLCDLPLVWRLLLLLACAAHAVWVLPRHVLLCSADCFRGLRYDSSGWQIARQAAHWQAITLLPDSMALPGLIVVRFRLAGAWRVHSVCLLADSLPADQHRRLRVYLKFSRQRWRVAE